MDSVLASSWSLASLLCNHTPMSADGSVLRESENDWPRVQLLTGGKPGLSLLRAVPTTFHSCLALLFSEEMRLHSGRDR